jgi:hypothetical protein
MGWTASRGVGVLALALVQQRSSARAQLDRLVQTALHDRGRNDPDGRFLDHFASLPNVQLNGRQIAHRDAALLDDQTGLHDFQRTV